jgi:hypothetical protein
MAASHNYKIQLIEELNFWIHTEQMSEISENKDGRTTDGENRSKHRRGNNSEAGRVF